METVELSLLNFNLFLPFNVQFALDSLWQSSLR